MALVVADRVQETTSTTGTGTLTLSGAVSGYQSFSTIGNGNTTYYAIVSGTDWEVGLGTYTSAGTTLARTTILKSSAAGAAISVASGATVFGTYPADKAVYEDASDNLPIAGIFSAGSIQNTPIGSTTASTGAFTTLGASSTVTLSPASANVAISPTGTGTVTISPAGALTINPTAASTINNTSIGATTATTGRFTTVTSTQTTGTAPFTVASTTQVTNLNCSQLIGSTWAAPAAIGSTTPAAGTFTSLSATSRAGVLATAARTAGSVLAVAGSLTLTTAGTTLTSQTAATGAVWRVRAFGTYAAASSANVRTFTMACFWGTTQLTAITAPAAVLASTANTTNWNVEFEIATTGTTAAWVTGYLNQNTGVAVGASLLTTNATPASTVVTSGAQTLDLRVGQTGTATATDNINIHQVTIERIV